MERGRLFFQEKPEELSFPIALGGLLAPIPNAAVQSCSEQARIKYKISFRIASGSRGTQFVRYLCVCVCVCCLSLARVQVT